MTSWLLLTWLCAGPGPVGECAPLRTESYPTLALCRTATTLARAQNPNTHATCRQEQLGGSDG